MMVTLRPLCVPAFLLCAICLATGCTGGSRAETIIARAIKTHGGDAIDHVAIDFDFREYHYTFMHDGGYFRYQRARPDSAGYLRDVLDNEGFFREIDGRRVDLPDDRVLAYSSSVNGVAYFFLLPFKLIDAAVQPRYLGESTIEGEPYHEIEVTFLQEGGGRDYEDRFVFWFHREHDTMDYFAYDFTTDGGGTRFRKAINPREINGVRILDYENYSSDRINRPGDPIEDMDDAYNAGELTLISHIENTNVTIRPITPGSRGISQ